MSVLLVRADADASVGSGHFMRCLALAEAWRSSGGDVVFLSNCESEPLLARANSRSIPVIPLSEETGGEGDLRETLALLERIGDGTGGSWLCADGYRFPPSYHQAVRAAGWPLLVVDDFAHLAAYHASLVVNPGVHARRLPYAGDPDTRFLLGSEYALLRTEFLEQPVPDRSYGSPVRRVLVTFGGVDSRNMTLRAIRALRLAGITPLEAVVVVGGANPHYPGLERAAREVDGAVDLRLVRNATNMPELMAWADLAVSAGGGTCWELCYLGLPGLLVVTADNQRAVVAGLHEAGAMVSGGQADEVTEEGLAATLRALATDPQRLRRLSGRARQLVDGRGGVRLVAAMTQGTKHRGRHRSPATTGRERAVRQLEPEA